MSPSSRRQSLPVPFRGRSVAAVLLVLSCLGAGCRRPAALSGVAAMPLSGPIRMVDVAGAWGLDARLGHSGRSPLTILETAGGGGALLDYDGDGFLDIFLVGERRLMLYHNDGGRRCHDVSAAMGLGTLAPPRLRTLPSLRSGGGGRPADYPASSGLAPLWMGCAVGDVDNDGFPDLYVSGYRCSLLLHNRGGTRLVEIAAMAGVRNRDRWETSAAFFDADGDGREDLYVARYLRFGARDLQTCRFRGVLAACPPHYYDADTGVFYRNEGGLRFADRTRASGLAEAHGKGLGVAVADADVDGRPDLYVANDGLPADHYRNLGGGQATADAGRSCASPLPVARQFENVGLEAGTAYTAEGQRHAGMGADWGDVENDGRPDLVVTAFQHEGCTLFRNEPDLSAGARGGSRFTEVGAEAGLRAPTLRRLGFGAKFADFDNDGFLDLILANGHVQDTVHRFDETATYAQPPQLFHNDGHGIFRDVSSASGAAFGQPRVGRAVCVGDLDNDGRQDALLVDAEGAPLLLQNQTEADREKLNDHIGLSRRHHWLGLRLRGVRSARSGVGAVVAVVTRAGRQRREAGAGGSYLAASDPRVHFGLGTASRADRVIIRWPSGHVQQMHDVPADRWLTVVEEVVPDRVTGRQGARPVADRVTRR